MMKFKDIVHLHTHLVAKCPHCDADLSEMEAYLSDPYSDADHDVTADNEGYCRDWKEKKHAHKTCWECKRLLIVGKEDHGLYLVAGRSETDIRYLELLGKS